MSNKENVKIISPRPEDADFIAWIVAQGMHMDGVPSFLKKYGARENTLYSWQNTRLLRCILWHYSIRLARTSSLR